MFDRVQEWLESYLKWHAPKKLVSFSLTRLTQLEVGARRGEERNGKEKRGKERRREERKGKERREKEKRGKERKRKERKGKERRGKERKGKGPAVLSGVWITKDADQRGRVEVILKAPQAAAIRPMSDYGSQLRSRCWFCGERKTGEPQRRKTLEARERPATTTTLYSHVFQVRESTRSYSKAVDHSSTTNSSVFRGGACGHAPPPPPPQPPKKRLYESPPYNCVVTMASPSLKSWLGHWLLTPSDQA